MNELLKIHMNSILIYAMQLKLKTISIFVMCHQYFKLLLNRQKSHDIKNKRNGFIVQWNDTGCIFYFNQG